MPLSPADLATITALFHRMKDPNLAGMAALRATMHGVGTVLQILSQLEEKELLGLLLNPEFRPLYHIAQALEALEQSLREGVEAKVQ